MSWLWLVQDMNDILMLDMGGVGAFRTPLGSPPRSGSAHFSFDDPHQPPRPPDTDPLPPTWRVAEVHAGYTFHPLLLSVAIAACRCHMLHN